MQQDPDRHLQPTAIKLTASYALRVGLALIVVACSVVSGCVKSEVKPEPPAHEEPPLPQTSQAAAPDQPKEMPKLPPPRLAEVQGVVTRVFRDAALIDTGVKPNFIAGDFNGDLSQDIAVVVKPAPGKLSEMNEEFPAWILKDPFVPNTPRMPKLRIEENEVLLAVIHGYGANHWRDPLATQTYLLKNAVGSGMEAHPGKEFVTANRGKKLPRLHGDLIGEVLRGTSGYFYYAGATYSWYDPKTFKGEPARRFVHSRAGTRREGNKP